jgi:hypothetical protein
MQNLLKILKVIRQGQVKKSLNLTKRIDVVLDVMNAQGMVIFMLIVVI